MSNYYITIYISICRGSISVDALMLGLSLLNRSWTRGVQMPCQ